jgi:Holliday junction resolvasome RuvABC endonuclease subunit
VTVVLAFDVASTTGVAVGEAGGKPRAWAVNLGRGGEEPPRLAKAIRMTAAYCEKFKPDVVAVEAPVGGKDANALLVMLAGCVMGEAARHGCKVVVYFPATVRKHFLGKALTSRDFPGKSKAAAKGAIKGAVIARCKMLGWEIEGGDAADAASLWDFACAMQSRAHQVATVGGLFAGVRG